MTDKRNWKEETMCETKRPNASSQVATGGAFRSRSAALVALVMLFLSAPAARADEAGERELLTACQAAVAPGCAQVEGSRYDCTRLVGKLVATAWSHWGATAGYSELVQAGIAPEHGPTVWEPLFHLARRTDLSWEEAAHGWLRCLELDYSYQTLDLLAENMKSYNMADDGEEEALERARREVATALTWYASRQLPDCLQEYTKMPADQVVEASAAHFAPEEEGFFEGLVPLIPGYDLHYLASKLFRGHSIDTSDMAWAGLEVVGLFPLAKVVTKGGKALFLTGLQAAFGWACDSAAGYTARVESWLGSADVTQETE